MTATERVQFARLVRELARKVESNELGTELVLLQLEEITQVPRDAPLTLAGARAEDRRRWFELWYSTLRFSVAVPMPQVTDKEFARRGRISQRLFFRPSTDRVSYQAFMKSVGWGADQTVSGAAVTGIQWEPTEEGYWFWAEILNRVPRQNCSWQNLMFAHRLLSVEEYVIVCWAHWSETRHFIDETTMCWLRTRVGSGVLSASRLGTSLSEPVMLLKSQYNMGGRVVEVVIS